MKNDLSSCPDLSPAHWIWFPSERTLANTFVLFRRTVQIRSGLIAAVGWLTADSRYRLTVNGQRVQWGPAPCDPRWLDVDRVILTPFLQEGENIIGVEVLHYGHGDGTWPTGKPGLLCHFAFSYETGEDEVIVSDSGWLSFLDRAHRPGQYKRWYLRALQEDFDAQLHPVGWNTTQFDNTAQWLPAMELAGSANKPPISTSYDHLDYGGSGTIDPVLCGLRERSIPPMREQQIPAHRLHESGWVNWHRDPLDWFEFRTPRAFTVRREPSIQDNDGCFSVLRPLEDGEAIYLTFEFEEQLVGWTYFTIEAPAGTVVEVMTQESHDGSETSWLDTNRYCWSRFTCREGINTFECFDYESLRWLQLHIHGVVGKVKIWDVGVRRRMYDWAVAPHIESDDPALQKLFDAAINTIHNSAQETIVDGMGRERQQYSGDIGHALHTIRYLYGETKQTARFLSTFSQGITAEGYFLDCWPAYDRLWRVAQRQIKATPWGPLLDHSVGFVFDCWHHYLETGDLQALDEIYPRLWQFVLYLEHIQGKDGLLPVQDIGIPVVWMDHEAYQQQRHKQCAFNLYAAAMLLHAFVPLAQAHASSDHSTHAAALGQSMLDAATKRFWSPEHRMFVCNLPWAQEEGSERLCDRSLATSILYDQCPNHQTETSLQTLAQCPAHLGISYPANAGWRYHALARYDFVDVVLDEFRARWTTMKSVQQNNTLQEFWDARPDSTDQWCHFPISPMNVMFMDIAGIRPTVPGFAQCRIQPRLGSLKNLALSVQTVRGPIHFAATAVSHGHHVTVHVPANCKAELVLGRTLTGEIHTAG